MKNLRQFVILFLFTFLLYGVSLAIVEAPKEKETPQEKAPKSPLVKKIEARLGEELNNEQKYNYYLAVKKTTGEIENIQKKFIKDIAKITGISPGKIQVWLAKGEKSASSEDKNLITLIEKEKGKKLKKEEIDKIKAAYDTRKKGMLESKKNFAKDLSKITGIPEKEIMKMLP